jgi:hypothetical protein
MPLTTPRELAILHNLQAALRTLTEMNGYGFTVKHDSVVLDAENIFNIPETRLPFNIVEPTDDGDRRFAPAHQLFDVFEWVITARVDAKGDDPNRRYTLGLQYAADLERVLTVDLERGGLTADTRLRKPQVFTSMSGDQTVLVVQRGSCHLHRTFGDPT